MIVHNVKVSETYQLRNIIFILVANQTVGTECPVGNNVDPDSSDVCAVKHKQNN